MQAYPEINIDVRTHTDSRGDDNYNFKLSEKRAKSVMNYLIGHGIAKERLTSHGYGETQLVNNCGNGIKCSEEEHQLNRRSEFIVVE